MSPSMFWDPHTHHPPPTITYHPPPTIKHHPPPTIHTHHLPPTIHTHHPPPTIHKYHLPPTITHYPPPTIHTHHPPPTIPLPCPLTLPPLLPRLWWRAHQDSQQRSSTTPLLCPLASLEAYWEASLGGMGGQRGESWATRLCLWFDGK